MQAWIMSPKKFYAKKALDRCRNKVETVPESPSLSLMHRMMNSVSAVRGDSPFNRDSSSFISKRASFCRSSSQEFNKHSNILDTHIIFKNDKYGDMMQVPSEEIQSYLFTESSDTTSPLGKEIIVCCNSGKKGKITRRCKCDVYEDIQSKWDHIKKSISEMPGTRNPFSMLKNFYSTLYGPTCTAATCPNRRERKERDKAAKRNCCNSQCIKIKCSKTKKCNTDPRMYCFEDSSTNTAAGCQDRDTQLEEALDAIKGVMCRQDCGQQTEGFRNEPVQVQELKVHKGIQNTECEREKPKLVSRPCQVDYRPNYRHCEQQYEKEGVPKISDPKTCDQQTSDPHISLHTFDELEEIEESDKSVGSCLSPCDESVQMDPPRLCTCATQHSKLGIANMRHRQKNSMVKTEVPLANPTNLHNDVADKVTQCTARKYYEKDAKTSASEMNQKLSLESSLLINRGVNIAQTLKDQLSACTITDTSDSSISPRSNGSKTDTTIYSLVKVNYDGKPRRRKHRLKLVTKQNQSTLTEKAQVCDTGTITQDWWSPLIERKANDPILLEKKRGCNLVEKQNKELRDLKEWRELRDVRKKRKGIADGRSVTFRSKTQIIPTALFPGRKDIMSPSRYLLESQKYYNELFAYNYRPRPQAVYNYVTQIPKYHEKEKTRSLVGSRRNHHRKTKRLDECYLPRRQLSPRKCKAESPRTSDSPWRKTSHQHDRQSNDRHNAKSNSPRKRV